MREPSLETAPELIPSAGRRILIVDDNVDASTSLERLLKLTGNEAYSEHDGERAVRRAATLRHRRKSKEAGFDAHMVKPVDYAHITKLLESLPSEHDAT
jgi:hypoxanthine phosphoribosyltransferase